MARSRWMLVSLAAAAVCASAAFSQSTRPTSSGTAAASRGEAANELVMTPGREAAALKFAQLHHPELEKLLLNLQKSNPAEYRRAVRRLYLDSERLARTAERSPERHELELEAWTLESRIRLLVARMSMSGNSELDRQLRALLRERLELRLRQLHQERDRVASRLANLEKSISDIESDPDAAAAKDLQRIKRSLGIPPARSATAGRTAPASPPGRRGAVSADAPQTKPNQRPNVKSTTEKSTTER